MFLSSSSLCCSRICLTALIPSNWSMLVYSPVTSTVTRMSSSSTRFSSFRSSIHLNESGVSYKKESWIFEYCFKVFWTYRLKFSVILPQADTIGLSGGGLHHILVLILFPWSRLTLKKLHHIYVPYTRKIINRNFWALGSMNDKTFRTIPLF